ncbi:MAG: hypothetical protein V3U24_06135 [Candidatus Neomarinimicrobiota bacterium]
MLTGLRAAILATGSFGHSSSSTGDPTGQRSSYGTILHFSNPVAADCHLVTGSLVT